MKISKNLGIGVFALLLLIYACATPTPTANSPQRPYERKHLNFDTLDIDKQTAEKQYQEKQQAKKRLSNTIQNFQNGRKQPFSVQKYDNFEEVSYSGPFVYYYTTFMTDPFDEPNYDTTGIDGKTYWATPVNRWMRKNDKDNFQFSYENYLDYQNRGFGDETFARSDDTYWYQWNVSNYSQRFAFRSGAQMYISGSADGTSPVETDGTLRYAILTWGGSSWVATTGVINDHDPPEDLIAKHNLTPLKTYTLITVVTKPYETPITSLGMKTPVFFTLINPLSRNDYFVDVELEGSRYISPLNPDDIYPNDVQINVNRHPNVETLAPAHLETVVYLYRLPQWKYIGRLDRYTGSGSYSFKWDGKDHTGTPLPNGSYVIEVIPRNHNSPLIIGPDVSDYLYIHIDDGPSAPPPAMLCVPDDKLGKRCVKCLEGQKVIQDGDDIICEPLIHSSQQHAGFGIKGTNRLNLLCGYVLEEEGSI